jgi:hypothetical protein
VFAVSREEPVASSEKVRAGLGAAVVGRGGSLSVADRLCHACVELLEVDGAAISLIHAGASRGTYGSSNELSRRLDEFQFTFGEGPCMDAVRVGRPVFVADFKDPREDRWPAYAGAALDAGVRAVFALPVAVAAERVGALDLFRSQPGPLSDNALSAGLLAADLAALAILDLMKESDSWPTGDEHDDDGWSQLASLARVEVYQATGMVMGQLGVGPAEALLRLRAHAFATNLTASAVAWSIVERRLSLDSDESWDSPYTGGSSR